MSTDQIAPSDSSAEQRDQQIRRDLRRLGWYDWSLWALALLVILAMTATLAAVLTSVSGLNDSFFSLNMTQSIRGLVGLVLLFSVYTFYQQLQLKRTRARLANQVAVAIQERDRAERALTLVATDASTGLHSEPFGQLRLESEIARARRTESALTVLMLGVDNFEKITDRYGLEAGELALKTLAGALNKAIRGCDLAVLLGKGDMMVILPDCPLEQVRKVVDRLVPLRINVDGKMLPLTLTASPAGYKPDETPEALCHRARQAFETQRQNRTNQPSPVA